MVVMVDSVDGWNILFIKPHAVSDVRPEGGESHVHRAVRLLFALVHGKRHYMMLAHLKNYREVGLID